MAVDGGTKLGLVSRWSEAVEGWSEVCCVDQSQDVDLKHLKAAALEKLQVYGTRHGCKSYYFLAESSGI